MFVYRFILLLLSVCTTRAVDTTMIEGMPAFMWNLPESLVHMVASPYDTGDQAEVYHALALMEETKQRRLQEGSASPPPPFSGPLDGETYEDFYNRQVANGRNDSIPYFEAFRPLEKIMQKWDEWMAAYPGKIEKILMYPWSDLGEKIYVFKVHNGDGVKRPSVFIQCATHANEWISTPSGMYIVQQMLADAGGFGFLKHVNLYIVPVANVDGFKHTWSGVNGRMQRGAMLSTCNMRTISTSYCVDHADGADGARSYSCVDPKTGVHPIGVTDGVKTIQYDVPADGAMFSSMLRWDAGSVGFGWGGSYTVAQMNVRVQLEDGSYELLENINATKYDSRAFVGYHKPQLPPRWWRAPRWSYGSQPASGAFFLFQADLTPYAGRTISVEIAYGTAGIEDYFSDTIAGKTGLSVSGIQFIPHDGSAPLKDTTSTPLAMGAPMEMPYTTRGPDPNRVWAVEEWSWGADQPGYSMSKYCTQSNFHGQFPFQVRANQAIANFLSRLDNVIAVWDIHSFGADIINEGSYIEAAGKPKPGQEDTWQEGNAIADAITVAMKGVNGVDYDHRHYWYNPYSSKVTGHFPEYAAEVFPNAYTYTIEMLPSGDYDAAGGVSNQNLREEMIAYGTREAWAGFSAMLSLITGPNARPRHSKFATATCGDAKHWYRSSGCCKQSADKKLVGEPVYPHPPVSAGEGGTLPAPPPQPPSPPMPPTPPPPVPPS